MAKQNVNQSQEKFKTMIGGQALIEGILMRGPEKDCVVCRNSEGLHVEVKERKKLPKHSPWRWPLLRGVYGFFDAQVTGVKALLHSADLCDDEEQKAEPGKLDRWMEKHMSSEQFQKFMIGSAAFLGVAMSILLFFLLPMVIGGFFDRWVQSNLGINLIEGVIRMAIFMAYMITISRMKEMKRLFSYHGAEHKTIRCYEAELPLTVENVRVQTRLHPRCGTSFLLVVMILSILVFSIASSLLLTAVPALAGMRGGFAYKLLMIVFKLLLLPVVVAFAYELNRWVGRHDHLVARILRAPGMWMQLFTTQEPDDSMIECAIESVKRVLPEEEGSDRW